MIKNDNGYIPVEQFVEEMKSRNLSLEDLTLLYEQYKRYNYISTQTVKKSCSEVKEVQLKCYPVCECGHIFTELEYIKNPIEGERLHGFDYNLIPIPIFKPERCPNCGKKISSIAIKQFDAEENINFRY